MSREMKNSGIPWIGEVPKNWTLLRTKNVFTIGKEIVGKQSSQTQLLSLTTKGIKSIPAGSTSGKVPDSYDTYQIVHKNDLVMCLFDLDCSAVFSGLSSIDGMISPAYKVLSFQRGFSPRFYDYWYAYIFDGRKYKFLSKNIRYSLTYDEFAALGIVAPSFTEQQAIADVLDKKCGEIDEMISLQEKIIEELKAYKQSVITEAVCKGLNPDVPMKDSGIEWIGQIPEGWEVRRFKDILKAPLQYGVGESGLPYDSSLPRYVRITDIANNTLKEDIQKLSLTEEQAYGCILEDGDILLARSGGTVGKAFIFKSSYGRCAYAGYLIRAQVSARCSSWYVFYYTQTSCYEEWKKQIFIQSTIQNIAADRYSIMEIPLPPVGEQQAIADYLDTKCAEIDALISVKQSKIDNLKEYKKSIIYEYITGKKEVV